MQRKRALQQRAAHCGRIVAATLFVLAGIGLANAQTYPVKPIRLIVPYAPGGGLDFTARTIAQRLTERWGQPVVIDHRAGAATIVATELTARAAPDGHTLLMITTAFAINPSLHRKLPYDPLRDFSPVTQLTAVATVLAVHPSLPVRSVGELVALAKAKPGGLVYASPGAGTAAHLAVELLKVMTGIDMVHVPYKGSAPAVTDVIGGHVAMVMMTTISVGPHVKAGRLRALAVTTRNRIASLPEVPTFGETIPGYVVDALQGLIAPRGVPRPIVDALQREIADILKLPEVRERLAAEGGVAVGSTPDEFTAYLRSEIAKWTKVVQASGARAE